MSGRRVGRRTLLLGGLGACAATVGGAAWQAAERLGPHRLLWRRRLPVRAEALHLAGDTLLVAGGGLGAYSAADGAVRWRQDAALDDIAPGRSGTPPFTHDADAFAMRIEGGGSAVVRVAGLGDGAERWRRAFEGYLGGTLLTAGATVVASADTATGRGVAAFDASGPRWWRPAENADGPFDLAAAGATLLVAARELAAHDLADGTRRWGVAGAEGEVFGRPALRGTLAAALGMRYVDDDYGYHNVAAYAMDAADGRIRWRYISADGALLDAPPLLAGPAVVVRHESGRLTGLDAHSGRVRWSADRAAADAAVLADRVYVANPDGVVALDPASGGPGLVLDEPDSYRLAVSGSWLCVAAGESLAAYRIS
jgi:outer membrane protein assembly factor BamB